MLKAVGRIETSYALNIHLPISKIGLQPSSARTSGTTEHDHSCAVPIFAWRNYESRTLIRDLESCSSHSRVLTEPRTLRLMTTY